MEDQTPHQCPHLGILDDPNTSHSFPSTWNACFHSKVPTMPTFEHQEKVCLTDGYVSCPVYLAKKGEPFPEDLRNEIKSPVQQQNSKRNYIYYGVGAVLLLVLAGWLISAFFKPLAAIAPSSSSLPSNGTLVVATDTLPVRLTATSEFTPISSATFVSTTTPTVDVPPAIFKPFAFETPFKIGDKDFLIHRLKDGDGLDYLSKIYHTTPEVIKAINYSLKVPIWVDSLILIRPDTTSLDAADQAFEIYEVKEKVILIDELAKKLEVDLVKLKYYNICADNCIISRGDWVLVPRHK